MFLSGLIGGPSLYTEKYGEPRMRTRHAFFHWPLRSVTSGWAA